MSPRATLLDEHILDGAIPQSPRRPGPTAFGAVVIAALPLLIVAISVGGASYGQWLRLPPYRRDVLWSDFLLGRLFEATFGLWIFTVGASIASFLNVVAWRVPRGMTVGGHSLCPKCRHAIRPSDNIPIIGWLRLRGACRDCSLPISGRYVSFELLGGSLLLALFVVEFLSGGLNLPGQRFSWDAYGLNSDLRRISPTIIWVAMSHSVVTMMLLAVFMTRWSAAYLPPAAVWVVTALLIALHVWQPATAVADLWGQPLAAIDLASARWQVLKIDVLAGLSGIFAASALARFAFGGRYPMARAAEKETMRQRLQPGLALWIATAVMVVITLRLPLGLAALAGSTGLAMFARRLRLHQTMDRRRDVPMHDAISWLLPLSLLGLALWGWVSRLA